MSVIFDLAIIGGGIHGAGIAQAAAASGYQVVLIEKTDWASGTSSKSSKLIHGGLRYIEGGHFSLVRESLRERELLLKLAPDLVKRKDFYIPLYRDSQLSPMRLRIGLSLYSLLSGFSDHSYFQRLAKSDWANLNGLDTRELKAVFKYSDAQTDDYLLTCAVVNSAKELGAELICPAELMSAHKIGDEYQLQLTATNGEQRLRCRYLINAAGAWANSLCNIIIPEPPKPEVELVQGTHLVLAPKLSEHCFYLEAPQDGRGVFVLPWYDKTLVGTTETIFHGNPNDCVPLPHETTYLQSVLTHYFPNYKFETHDSFAGLRVLPSGVHHPFFRNREVQLIKGRQYLGIYGGKLTGYRATAAKALRYIRQSLGNRHILADTAEIPLSIPPGRT